MLANVASPEILGIILVVLVVVFGGSQLPKIARNVGSAGKEFRKAQREAEEEEAKNAKPAPPAVTAGPVVPAPPAAVAAPPPVVVGPADDKVTISKAELAALLDERLGKSDRGSANESTGLNN